ncbi:MAG TPA: 3-oxoacyl-[acyl-carrier-protein] synthase III C-terminal domain-containing protein, partial [Bdellovibrio sp.]|nr:3-oxoacyl-[acyl-carrier-protein] synthase III C-terminal domain-containing protein [Bdellovibrio sp.]
SIQPPYMATQEECFRWLAEAHSIAQDESRHLTKEDYLKLFHRVGCSPEQIHRRYFFIDDVSKDDWQTKSIYPVQKSPRGVTMQRRHEVFHQIARKLFEDIYSTRSFPDDIIHVSCTGYISPSAAQLIAVKSEKAVTVTHSYHMGCYGAFPALRMASGFLSSDKILGKKKSVDLVHTELCSIHLNPQASDLEQMVIQSLFADGCIAYRMSHEKPQKGFQIKGLHEEIIPNTADAMEWMVSDWNMQMTLSKNVPTLVGEKILDVTSRWLKSRDYNTEQIRKTACFAIHPGGPKIIDQLKEKLELREDQVQASRTLLQERGNMSSATLPHLWQNILDDEKIPLGTPIISYAFGPGLTVCIGYMEKI